MEPITSGMQGAAVEDVQSRLLQLGYTIDADEIADKRFGATTEQAVGTFRLDSGLAAGHAVDIPCWSALVDASYKLGDRTLYLRMPNLHGADAAHHRVPGNENPVVSPRAVGAAVARNPISIIVPCHRVVAADGSLNGYAGGLDRDLVVGHRVGRHS